MARVTRTNASADASVAQKKPSAKKPRLAIEAPPPAKASYDEAPFPTASQTKKAISGKTWEVVSCICKSGNTNPACAFCCKKSHWDPPVEGKRKREKPVVYMEPEATVCPLARNAVKKACATPKGEGVDDDGMELTRKQVVKSLGKAEPALGKAKSSHTLTSNGKQSCLFHCAHDKSTEAILKVWKSTKPIPHKIGPKVDGHFVAMSSTLNKCIECERKISWCAGCKKMVDADQHKKGLAWKQRTGGVAYHPEDPDEHKKWDKPVGASGEDDARPQGWTHADQSTDEKNRGEP